MTVENEQFSDVDKKHCGVVGRFINGETFARGDLVEAVSFLSVRNLGFCLKLEQWFPSQTAVLEREYQTGKAAKGLEMDNILGEMVSLSDELVLRRSQ